METNNNDNNDNNDNKRDLPEVSGEIDKDKLLTAIHTRAVEIFDKYYKNKTGLKYSYIGKDFKHLKSILERVFKISPIKTEEYILEGWRVILEGIKDQWILNNLSISNINSKFNEILKSVKASGALFRKTEILENEHGRFLVDSEKQTIIKILA